MEIILQKIASSLADSVPALVVMLILVWVFLQAIQRIVTIFEGIVKSFTTAIGDLTKELQTIRLEAQSENILKIDILKELVKSMEAHRREFNEFKMVVLDGGKLPPAKIKKQKGRLL